MDHLLIENFLEMMASERDAAINTLGSYQRDLLRVEKFLGSRKQNFLSAELADLLDYAASLKKLRPSSVARKISSLKSFYNFLHSEKYIPSNIAIDLETPKQQQSLPKALTKEEINLLLQAVHQNTSKEGVRLALMLEIMYSAGLRVSELVSLKLSDLAKNVSNDQQLIATLIKGKGGKERLIIINERAQLALDKYLGALPYFCKGQKTAYLFPSFTKDGRITHITRQRFFQELKQLAISCNIDPELVSPHKIRHSFATHLLQGGMDLRSLQELMGHADISSTQIYTSVMNEDLQRTLMTKHPLAKGDFDRN